MKCILELMKNLFTLLIEFFSGINESIFSGNEHKNVYIKAKFQKMANLRGEIKLPFLFTSHSKLSE